MTVSTTANSIQYAGNGVTTSFSFPYVFFADSDLVVTLFIVATSADYSPAPVLNGGATYDYTISGTFDADLGEYPAGANVVFTTAPPTGYTVVLVRDVPATQDVDLLDNTKFPASTVNGEFDKLTVLSQQAGAATDRSLHLPSSDSLALTTEIPNSATRASKYLGFDASGNPTALAAPANTTAISSFWATIVLLTTAAASRLALGFSAIAAKGDLLVGTALNTIGTLTVGANGTVPMANATATTGISWQGPFGAYIYGLTYANNVSDATNDIDIATGGAMDATNAWFMPLASSLTKRLDAAWAVGTNQGGLDTGSIGNSDYYIWLIGRTDQTVVDVLYSLSSTAPTMPASYTFKRLIGWFKRVAATIVPFLVYELEGGGITMNWVTPTLDINLANAPTTTRRTDAVKVPLNFATTAHVRVMMIDNSSGFNAIVCSPDEADVAPSGTAAPLGIISAASTVRYFVDLRVRTSAAGLVAARADLATVDFYQLVTIGFDWSRR